MLQADWQGCLKMVYAKFRNVAPHDEFQFYDAVMPVSGLASFIKITLCWYLLGNRYGIFCAELGLDLIASGYMKQKVLGLCPQKL